MSKVVVLFDTSSWNLSEKDKQWLLDNLPKYEGIKKENRDNRILWSTKHSNELDGD